MGNGKSASQRKQDSLTIVKAIGAFLFGLTITAALIHVLPINRLRLYAEQRSEKLTLMDNMHGSANSAAFGSSHVHFGFDPRAFDATINLPSYPSPKSIQSVNLGVQGGSQTEQRVMAQAFLNSLHNDRKWPQIILLELNAGVNFTPEHLMHPRAINIYDWDTVRFASAFTQGLPTTQRVGRLSNASVCGIFYLFNVGVVSNTLFGAHINTDIYRSNTENNRRGLFVEPVSHSTTDTLKKVLAGPVDIDKIERPPLLPGNRRLIDELVSQANKQFDSSRKPQFAYIITP